MMISSNPGLIGDLYPPIEPGEIEGGFLIPREETWRDRLKHSLYCGWLRVKWVWRRNVRPLP